MNKLKPVRFKPRPTQVVIPPPTAPNWLAVNVRPPQELVVVQRTTTVQLRAEQTERRKMDEPVESSQTEEADGSIDVDSGVIDPHEKGFERLQALIDRYGSRLFTKARSPEVRFLERIGLRLPPPMFWPWPALFLFFAPPIFLAIWMMLNFDDWSKGFNANDFAILGEYSRSAVIFRAAIRDSLVLAALVTAGMWLAGKATRRRLGLPDTWRQFIASNDAANRP